MAQDIIVAIFPSRDVLTRALDHLNELENFEIEGAAIVAKARSGETIVLDDDISPNEGGITGGTLGAAMTTLGLVQLGVLALPGVGPIIALGAGVLVGGIVGQMTGRFAANLLDFGFKNEQIEKLAQNLQAGHPALVLQVEDGAKGLKLMRQELKSFQAELIEPLHRAASGTNPRAPED